jgi:hypothetical protein
LGNADYVNILGRSVNTVQEEAEGLILDSNGIGLDVNAGKNK